MTKIDESEEREALLARDDLSEPERVRLAHLIDAKLKQLSQSLRTAASPALATIDQMLAQAEAMAQQLEQMGEADELFQVVAFAHGGDVTTSLASQLLDAAEKAVFYAGMNWDGRQLEHVRKCLEALEETLADREEDLAERERRDG